MRAWSVLTFAFLVVGSTPRTGAATEDEPAFHFVLCDGNQQLHGQGARVADSVVAIFREMGIRATWSPPTETSLAAAGSVNVVVLPHSSRDWRMPEGVLATVRWGEESRGVVFLFYPDVERALDYAPGRYQSILHGGKPPAPSWQNGLARVIAHEILHYFLPGRPHDASGIFMSHIDGSLLMSSSLQLQRATKDALVQSLLDGDVP